MASLLLTTHGYAALVEELATLAEPLGRWVAFGGGGYDVSVVPRAWTLAYGVMSAQSFPDELPPAYGERYGPGRLHDAQAPEPRQAWVVEQTRNYVEKCIATLRAQTQDVWQWE